jgi:hypothetical protein
LSAGDLGIAPAFSVDVILPRILSFRDQRVILDADLAALYDVPTKRFNESVKRNLGKFPHDFMFQLTAEEFDALRSQFATSNSGRGGRRYSPRVFTEHGALMAATILSSPVLSKSLCTLFALSFIYGNKPSPIMISLSDSPTSKSKLLVST